MNLLDKLISDFIQEAIGKDVIILVDYLKKRSNVSEFKIAEKLELTVNQTRNMLYRLYSYSLVDFTRKKDKKKGWYIYYWDFYVDRALDVALVHKERRINLLRDLLKREETGQYFSCPGGDVRLGFEQAIEHGFKCPECDKVLTQDNNSRKISNLTRSIEELGKETEEGRKLIFERKEKQILKSKKLTKEEKPKSRKLKKKVSKGKTKVKTKSKIKPKSQTRKKPSKRSKKRVVKPPRVKTGAVAKKVKKSSSKKTKKSKKKKVVSRKKPIRRGRARLKRKK